MVILDYILYYLIAGLLFSFWIERMTVVDGGSVSWKERVSLIVLWPLMVITFIYHFVKAFFE